MAENITYAEMNLTFDKGKGQGKTNSVNLQDEDVQVTYADIKKPPVKKKVKSSKREKGKEQDTIFQPQQSGGADVTYASVCKKTTPMSHHEDSAGGDDITVTYAALKETTKEKGRKGEESQEGHCVQWSIWKKCLTVREDEEPPDWKHRVLRGRHCSLLPVPFLVLLCLILLTTTIISRTSCITSGRNTSGPSSSSDFFSPCPDPWILVTNKCYFFSENQKNYKDSKEDCEKRNSRLATVKEGTILKLVNITAQEFWIGLERLGTYHQDKPWSGRWADGSIENLPQGSGSCAKMKGGLHLNNCQQDLHWICEKEVSDQ